MTQTEEVHIYELKDNMFYFVGSPIWLEFHKNNKIVWKVHMQNDASHRKKYTYVKLCKILAWFLINVLHS